MHYSTVQIMYFYVRNNERRTVNTVSGSSLGAPKSQRRSSTKQQNAELPNDVARKRQQRFLEKKAAEKATSPKRATSEAVPKEPESVPKELDLSSEIRYQECAGGI